MVVWPSLSNQQSISAAPPFNLHTVHSPEGLQRSADAFRRLIARAVLRGGTYYLTIMAMPREARSPVATRMIG
jgi:hypothetical protein